MTETGKFDHMSDAQLGDAITGLENALGIPTPENKPDKPVDYTETMGKVYDAIEKREAAESKTHMPPREGESFQESFERSFDFAQLSETRQRQENAEWRSDTALKQEDAGGACQTRRHVTPCAVSPCKATRLGG